MALRFPFRVKARTSTTGTSTYTIDESAPAAGWRSVSEAVLDGDLANGDQFPYIVVDSTVTGRVKLFELGIGTWNNTTKQVARDVIYQPSAGAVSWGMGTRDFAIVDNPVLFLLLAGGTMSGALKVLLSGAIVTPDAGTGVLVQRSATTATPAYMAIVSGNASTAGLNLGDTNSDLSGGVWYDNANNALIFRTSGTNGPRVDSSGVLRDSAGTAYLTSAGGASVPAGSVTDWYQAAAPSGWTRITTVNDKVPIIVSAGSPGTVNSETWAIDDLSAAAHALTIAEIPAHTHNVAYGLAQGIDGGTSAVDVLGAGSNSANTGSAGSGAAHSHNVNSAGSWRPPGAYMLLASKN